MIDLKKGVSLILVFVMVVSIAGVYAQENGGESVLNSVSEPTGEGFGESFDDGASSSFESELKDGSDEIDELIAEAEEFDEELEVGAGLTPDSLFYFLDGIIDSREEKIAEMRVTAERCAQGDEGSCNALDVAFEKYKEYADEFEREVSPDEREEAERTSRAIRMVLIRDIAQNVDPTKKDELVREIVKKESDIERAAQIAVKIKELCSELKEIDLDEFDRTCSFGEGEARWKKKLYDELTAEQKEQVREFGGIMKQCFRTDGRDCDCGAVADIAPFMADFSKACFEIAPLAAACADGDETACEAEQEVEVPFDELPDYLQEVMFEIENEFNEDKFDRHMPPECVEAGARTPRDCMRVMIELNAPEECRDALIEADVQNEREAREICENIMFELNAPEECIEAGLRDPKECGRLMFRETAPQECLDAGLTGERQSDHKKCREIMENLGGREGPNRGPNQGFNFNCRRIEDAKERLNCYDNAVNNIGEHFEDRRGPGAGFPPECREAGALDRQSCERIMKQNFDERFRETREEQNQCAEKCGNEGKAWDFRDGNCRCFEGDFRDSFESYQRQPPPEGFEPEFGLPPEGNYQEGQYSPPPEYSQPSEPEEPELSPEPEFPSGTGQVIGTGNAFLEYYYYWNW